jgi:2-keto-4-pentenoate hydratase/2-oxohepta-3-ene-1,7-dioic acid hydratase in catechol pathway
MRIGIAALLLVSACSSGPSRMLMQDRAVRFARFEAGGKVHVGVVEGDRVRAISGDLFGTWQKTEQTWALAEVKLLVPVESRKVLALAGNYRSHLGTTAEPKNPELFFKLPTCLVPHGAEVVIPPGTAEVHFEAELVVVVGKRLRNATLDQARAGVFGVTCGNDISARDWQKGDRQWWRAKGCDTFGPIGPFLVTGLNYDDLLLEMRVNGESKQKQRTSDHIFKVAETLSFVSKHVTLEPGDTVFMGTPAQTSAIKPGDVMEVEIEGIGVLRNKVVAGP